MGQINETEEVHEGVFLRVGRPVVPEMFYHLKAAINKFRGIVEFIGFRRKERVVDEDANLFGSGEVGIGGEETSLHSWRVIGVLHGYVEGCVECRPTVRVLAVELREADLFRRWLLQDGGELLKYGERCEIRSGGRGW